VLRPRLTEPVRAEIANPAVCEERPDRLRGVVGGAVVDDQQFPVGEGLGDDGLDRRGEEPGVVLRRHHNGNRRLARPPPHPPPGGGGARTGEPAFSPFLFREGGRGVRLASHALIAWRWSRATFEMQKRYFPLGSCGIASTSSTSCRTLGPKVSWTS